MSGDIICFGVPSSIGQQLPMTMTDGTKIKQGENCLYLCTHQQCNGCLGTPAEVAKREKQGFKGYDAYL